MSSRSRRRLVLSAVATVAVSFVSCDKSPTSPSPASPLSPPGAFVRLEVSRLKRVAESFAQKGGVL
jgi:hypothetical protein